MVERFFRVLTEGRIREEFSGNPRAQAVATALAVHRGACNSEPQRETRSPGAAKQNESVPDSV
jgi:hypothetical protein